MVSRRDALRALVGGGLLTLAGTANRTTASASPVGRDRIDLHAHMIPPAYREAVLQSGLLVPGGLPLPNWSPESALSFMDEFGIAAQVLSVSDPGVRFAKGAEAVRLARYCNEYAAGLVRDNPTRFGSLTTLPLPDVPTSLAEIEHGLDVLQMDGVMLLSSYDGIYLGDPRFEPIMAMLDSKSALVFVHPGELPAASTPPLPLPPFLLEFPFETTRTAVEMILSGTLDRYRNIRFVLAHAGGCLPFLRTRIGAPRAVAPDLIPSVSLLGVEEALRRFYYDTALSAAASSMRSVLEVTGADHVVFGTDWPFSGLTYSASDTDDPAPGLSEVFDADGRALIERATPLSLLPRLAAALR
ncbi:MAG: amidohydrolase family protein [Rhodococcus sp. (in: high G+C Gram-positive bacteria)]